MIGLFLDEGPISRCYLELTNKGVKDFNHILIKIIYLMNKNTVSKKFVYKL